ncbi:MAG: four-carbon acid sugar kinase family protein [Lachnospiraceae bacterium]|nr:four-carbon acid sugar kinase family protein [Lachnospiraceae bacterium]
MEKKLILGCIADDFTGASDAASFLVKGGMQTILFNGVPQEQELAESCQAIVIALKTRTQETSSAVEDTLRAARWLKHQGARQIYIKYCSTFDSTPQGNIGPIMDAMLEEFQVPYTILCPALPVNGRIVRQGHLYVNGVPLHESPMKNHPLTPMWDSSIAGLMEPQSRYSCINITKDDYLRARISIEQQIQEYGQTHRHFYIVPDYTQNDDAATIVRLFGSLPVLSGGSGILTELARQYAQTDTERAFVSTSTEGSGILLAGSCSEMTRRQIAYAQSHDVISLQIQPLALLSGEQTPDELWAFLEANRGKQILLYSSDTPDNVRKIQESGREKIAELLEQTTAALARRAVETGYTRIIVAGGETSGAVTKALGFDSYIIGESVAPGVPVMIPRSSRQVRLVLKSGNFGQEDFFIRALHLTGK